MVPLLYFHLNLVFIVNRLTFARNRLLQWFLLYPAHYQLDLGFTIGHVITKWFLICCRYLYILYDYFHVFNFWIYCVVNTGLQITDGDQ